MLAQLVGQHTVRAAILASGDSDVISFAPEPAESEQAAATRQWALDLVASLSGIRDQMPEEAVSVLFDASDSSHRMDYHVQRIGSNVLVLLFSDSSNIGRVRTLAREAASPIGALLVPES